MIYIYIYRSVLLMIFKESKLLWENIALISINYIGVWWCCLMWDRAIRSSPKNTWRIRFSIWGLTSWHHIDLRISIGAVEGATIVELSILYNSLKRGEIEDKVDTWRLRKTCWKDPHLLLEGVELIDNFVHPQKSEAKVFEIWSHQIICANLWGARFAWCIPRSWGYTPFLGVMLCWRTLTGSPVIPLVCFTAKKTSKSRWIMCLEIVRFSCVFLKCLWKSCFNSPCLPDHLAGFCCSHLIEKPTNRQLKKRLPPK